MVVDSGATAIDNGDVSELFGVSCSQESELSVKSLQIIIYSHIFGSLYLSTFVTQMVINVIMNDRIQNLMLQR